jgi:hypothetical protein
LAANSRQASTGKAQLHHGIIFTTFGSDPSSGLGSRIGTEGQ